MRDLMFLLLPVGFFVLAAAYVRGCAAVVGPDVADAPHRARVADTDESGVAG